MARMKRAVPAALDSPPEISVESVSKSYEGVLVLDEVSLSVRPGRTLIVMGPSGVGKTTLIRILIGLLEPDDGSGGVAIGGRDVLEASDAELRAIRQGMGTLLGGSSVYDSSVFTSMSTWENIRYPLSLRGHDEAFVEEQTWRRIDEFELGAFVEHDATALSAGTRRRLALARAFVEEPPLLVLDDPGAALDITNRHKIIDSIKRARDTTAATVVLACHDIEMARKLGDDMVVLLAGRVVAAGPVSEVLDGVTDADTYDQRFGVKGSFALSDALSTIDRVREDVREASQEHWLVYGTLLVMAVVTLVALIIGFGWLGWSSRF